MSITRPTVPTTTCASCFSRDAWSRIGAPPKTATTSMPRLAAVGAQRLGHLDAQLARRREHQRLDRGSDGIEVVEQRQAEGGGLAGAGLRLADHVPSLQQQRDRLLLDRGRVLVAEVLERVEHLLREAELGEGRHAANQTRRWPAGLRRPPITAPGRAVSLPRGAAGLEVLVGAGGLGERVGAADARPQLAAGGAGEQVGERLLEHVAAVEQVHQPEADDRAARLQQLAVGDRDLLARGVAVGDDPAERGKRGQALLEDPPAGRVEHHVDRPAAVRVDQRGGQVLGVGIDGHVGAQLERLGRAAPPSRRSRSRAPRPSASPAGSAASRRRRRPSGRPRSRPQPDAPRSATGARRSGPGSAARARRRRRRRRGSRKVRAAGATAYSA